MKAIFTTACGASQMLDIMSPPPHTYRLPIKSRHAEPVMFGGPQTYYSYREFDLEEVVRMQQELVAMYHERWVS